MSNFIRTLPVELLADILGAAADQEPRSLMCMASVCRHWNLDLGFIERRSYRRSKFLEY